MFASVIAELLTSPADVLVALDPCPAVPDDPLPLCAKTGSATAQHATATAARVVQLRLVMSLSCLTW
jgi:hypothetical protein